MSHLPLISVVVPVYNGERFLSDALESVLSQTYSNVEVIVVDDGSDDGTPKIAREFSNVRYVHQQNQGVSAARNTGISMAGGEYIAFLDADDIWKPCKLTRQISFMMDNSNIQITGTKAENFLEPGSSLPFWLQNDKQWKEVNEFLPSTMIVETSVFSEIGGFSVEYKSAEDTEWLWRARDAGIEIDLMDEILTRRRYHGKNLSWVRKAEHKSNMMKIVKQSIHRKTGKSGRR